MENNKVTISYLDFAADLAASQENETTIHWLGKDITIKKFLTMPETLSFVSDVVDVCYQGEGEVLTYMPEVQAYAVQYSLVAYYTNIDLQENEDSAFDVYDFIVQSGIADVILNHIDLNQYDAMVKAIGSKIRYINETSAVSIMSEMGALNNAINEIVPQIQSFIGSENAEKIEAALAALTSFSEDATLRQLAMAQVKNG